MLRNGFEEVVSFRFSKRRRDAKEKGDKPMTNPDVRQILNK